PQPLRRRPTGTAVDRSARDRHTLVPDTSTRPFGTTVDESSPGRCTSGRDPWRVPRSRGTSGQGIRRRARLGGRGSLLPTRGNPPKVVMPAGGGRTFGGERR